MATHPHQTTEDSDWCQVLREELEHFLRQVQHQLTQHERRIEGLLSERAVLSDRVGKHRESSQDRHLDGSLDLPVMRMDTSHRAGQTFPGEDSHGHLNAPETSSAAGSTGSEPVRNDHRRPADRGKRSSLRNAGSFSCTPSLRSEMPPAIAWANSKHRPTMQRLDSMWRQANDRRSSASILDPTKEKKHLFKKSTQSSYPGGTSRLGRIVETSRFECIIIVLIMANTIGLGAQVQWSMDHIDEESSQFFEIWEGFFTVIFTIELLLRGANERRLFFSTHNPNFSWNIFDFSLIVASISCRIMTIGWISAPNVSFLRLFRVLRLFRAFRVLRIMRFFSDVRIMVAGIIRSLQSLAWAILLLGFIMYIVAVCVMQIVRDELHEHRLGRVHGNTIDEEALMNYYGSLQSSVFTLYLSICGGIDWFDAISPLSSFSPVLVVFFCLYIAFAVFCVLNVITGVFVDNATKLTAKDEENVLQEEIDNRMHWFKAVQQLFSAVDDGSGHVTLATFYELINDIEAQAAFSKIGIELDVVNVDNLFKMLDFDNSGSIDMDEFIAGIEMYHGNAKRIDVSRLMHETRKIGKQVKELARQASATKNIS